MAHTIKLTSVKLNVATMKSISIKLSLNKFQLCGLRVTGFVFIYLEDLKMKEFCATIIVIKMEKNDAKY